MFLCRTCFQLVNSFMSISDTDKLQTCPTFLIFTAKNTSQHDSDSR